MAPRSGPGMSRGGIEGASSGGQVSACPEVERPSLFAASGFQQL